MEQDLKVQKEKNEEYKTKLNNTNNFIRKLAHILRCYRHKYKMGYCTEKDEENSRNRSDLEYLCGEVYRVINNNYKQKPQRHDLPRVKTMEHSDGKLEHIGDNEIANIMNEKDSMQSLPEIEMLQSNYIRKVTSTDSLISDICECCFNKFTWYKWKHNCRMCGKLVCQSCSSYKDYVVGYSDKKVRICKECFISKENARRNKNSFNCTSVD